MDALATTPADRLRSLQNMRKSSFWRNFETCGPSTKLPWSSVLDTLKYSKGNRDFKCFDMGIHVPSEDHPEEVHVVQV